jgi:hypothetical protein
LYGDVLKCTEYQGIIYQSFTQNKKTFTIR